MNDKRIIFMGTPFIASQYLQTLINSNFNIICVYTKPPRSKGRGMVVQRSPVHELALQNNIPVYFPDNFSDKETLYQFVNFKADITIVMAYGILLPQKILDAPDKGCINIHLSLLPRWRGAAPIEHSLLNGDKQTGVTIFRLIKKIDAGPIISQTSIPIESDINKGSLLDKLNILGQNLLINTLSDYCNDKVKLQEQDDTMVTYASKISNASRKIDFNDNVNNVFNKIRSFAPKPGAWFLLQKERIKIIECKTLVRDCLPSIIENKEFHIGCQGGLIAPRIIQREGKKPMGIGEFIKGYKFVVGQKVNE